MIGHGDIINVAESEVSPTRPLATADTWRYHAMTDSHSISHTMSARFWSKVNISGGATSCWPWMAGRLWVGYGMFCLRGKTKRAHRVAWEIANGEIPSDLCVLHRCDNPSCVNPAHLFLGTSADNTRDMVAKHRQAAGDRHGSHLHPERWARGERHGSKSHPERLARGDRSGARLHPDTIARGSQQGHAKLTEADVANILNLASTLRDGKIAERYGVSRTAIYAIRRRKSWLHVPDGRAAK